jgi:hypothetical protein
MVRRCCPRPGDVLVLESRTFWREFSEGRYVSAGSIVDLQGDADQAYLTVCFPQLSLSCGGEHMILRDALRFSIQLHVSFLGDREGKGIVLDLSLKGCQVESLTSTVCTGDSLVVSMYPFEGSSPITVQKASVCWARGQQFGLVFDVFDSKEQDRLRWYLANNQGAKAKPRV